MNNFACVEPELAPACSPPSVKESAERHLGSHRYSALKNVSCEYRDGVLVLRGCLASYYLKQLAQEVVTHLDGVERVDNEVQVLRPAVAPPQG